MKINFIKKKYIKILCSILFIFLGFWQLDRLKQKENLLSLIKQRSQLSSKIYDHNLKYDDLIYSKISLQATLLYNKSFLLYARDKKINNLDGYYLITPALINEYTAILINKGWISRRESLKILELAKKLPISQENIEATAVPAPKGNFFTPNSNLSLNQEVFYFNYNDLEKFIQKKIIPKYYLHENPHELTNQHSLNLIRDEYNIYISNRHLGYSLTWFAFAFICLFF